MNLKTRRSASSPRGSRAGTILLLGFAALIVALRISEIAADADAKALYGIRPAPEQTLAAAAEPEIVPTPPAVKMDGLRLQLRKEEAPSETGGGHPGATGSNPEIASGDQPDVSTSAEVRAIWEDVPLRPELQQVLVDACDGAGIDPLLMLGLIETESGFNEDIVSQSGDYGLCQLNHNYFDPTMTPEENLRAGVELLGRHLQTYGNVDAALTAYHVGHDDGTRSYAGVVLGKAVKWGWSE